MATENGRWIRLRLNRLPALLERGWVWSSTTLRRRHHLILISPGGAVWEFKLHQGAWVRKVEPAENEAT